MVCRRLLTALVLTAVLIPCRAALAEPERLVLDPEASTVSFTLGATLHTVEGTVRLSEGAVTFERAGGPASGRIVVDAASAETGRASRDEQMHERVLESAAYPRIVFTASRLQVEELAADSARVRLAGEMELLGKPHPLEIPAVVRREGDAIHVEADFSVPYVAWGLEDVSTFVLRVSDVVEVRVRAVGRIAP